MDYRGSSNPYKIKKLYLHSIGSLVFRVDLLKIKISINIVETHSFLQYFQNLEPEIPQNE